MGYKCVYLKDNVYELPLFLHLFDADGLSFSSQLHHMLSYVTGSSDDTRIMDDFCTLLFKDSDKLSDPKCLSGNPSQLKMFMMVLNRYNKETVTLIILIRF